MSEAKYREIVARMAIDTEFAQSVMADPDGFAATNGLSADEAGRLRAVRVEAGTAAPSRLGTRLSKTGFGGAHHALHHDHHEHHGHDHHEDDSHYEHDSHTESDQHHEDSHHGHEHEDDVHYEHDEHTEIDTHTENGPHGSETDTHFEQDEHTEYDSHNEG
jgi:hypothetical protein